MKDKLFDLFACVYWAGVTMIGGFALVWPVVFVVIFIAFLI